VAVAVPQVILEAVPADALEGDVGAEVFEEASSVRSYTTRLDAWKPPPAKNSRIAAPEVERVLAGGARQRDDLTHGCGLRPGTKRVARPHGTGQARWSMTSGVSGPGGGDAEDNGGFVWKMPCWV
jgi:hypothetical protein